VARSRDSRPRLAAARSRRSNWFAAQIVATGLPREVTVICAPRDTSRNNAEKCRFASAALIDFTADPIGSYLHYFSTIPLAGIDAWPGFGRALVAVSRPGEEAAPEPTSLLPIGAGLLGRGWSRRRGRRRCLGHPDPASISTRRDRLEDDVFLFDDAPRKLSEAELEEQIEADLAQWAGIKSSRNVEDWVTYLRSFPNGRFAEIAQVRLGRLLAETESPATGGAAAPVSIPTKAAAATQEQSVPAIRAEAEYDALSKGVTYLDPQGLLRRAGGPKPLGRHHSRPATGARFAAAAGHRPLACDRPACCALAAPSARAASASLRTRVLRSLDPGYAEIPPAPRVTPIPWPPSCAA
jgi:hypothetical protein